MRNDQQPYNFWPAYSDLALSMVLVLLLFLLAQYVFNTRLLLTQDLGQLRMRSLQQQVRGRLRYAEGVDTVYEDGNVQYITLNADFLFPADDTALTDRGRELLGNLSRVLRQNQNNFSSVAVEGHADVRRSRRFRRAGDYEQDYGNWRLSAERAIEVVQLFQAAAIEGSRLEVVGRSSYAPIDTVFRRYVNDPRAEERSSYRASLDRNRRIVIRLFYSENRPVHSR